MNPAHYAHRRAPRPKLLAGLSVGVIGLGQIGGSIIRRLAQHRDRLQLCGHDRQPAIWTRARQYARWCATMEELVSSSDLVILAVPVPQILRLLPSIAQLESRTISRKGRLIVMDTGTVKAPVIKAARRHLTAYDFVGLHPLSGSHAYGWGAASESLFENDRIVCCAEAKTKPGRVARELIRLLGAQPLSMDPVIHDRLIAITIGLPHLLAYAASSLPGREGAISRLHGRSWGSLTRVAASDPAMVAGFLSTNASEQLRVTRAFRRRLDRLCVALQDRSGSKLELLLRNWMRKDRA